MIGALLACVLTLCSDDMLGVLGNERLTWTPSEGATYYVVAIHTYGEDGFSVYTECAATNEPAKDLAGTSCYGDRLCVKACKPNPEGGADLCSDYNVTAPVQMWPWACVRERGCVYSNDGDARNDTCTPCEEPCYSGAPRRMPGLPECPQ